MIMRLCECHADDSGEQFDFKLWTSDAPFDWESWVPWLEQPISSSSRLKNAVDSFSTEFLKNDYHSFDAFRREWQVIKDEWALFAFRVS